MSDGDMIAPRHRLTAAQRKAAPFFRGLMKYFPDALVEVARTSALANEQHNPGEDLHWARGKSTDHLDCAGRHMLDAGTFDTDGARHTAKAAWRLLAELQIELERDAAACDRISANNSPEKGGTPRMAVQPSPACPCAECQRRRESSPTARHSDISPGIRAELAGDTGTCTDPDNCRRCKGDPGRPHAGIPS